MGKTKRKQNKPTVFDEQAASAAHSVYVGLRELFNRGLAQELAEFGLSRKTIRQIAREI